MLLVLGCTIESVGDRAVCMIVVYCSHIETTNCGTPYSGLPEMQTLRLYARFCTECGDYTNCIVCIFYSLGTRKCGR